MKCGTLHQDVLQRGPKVWFPVGFSHFSFGFSGFYFAVSEFETVFLRAVRSVSFFSAFCVIIVITSTLMEANAFVLKAAAAALASAHARNRNLSTGPKRVVVVKVWDAMMRGAHKCCKNQGFVSIHNMPHVAGVTGACENTDTLFTLDSYDGKKMCLPQPNQPYLGLLTQAVAGGRVCGEIQSSRKERNADHRRPTQSTLFEIDTTRSCIQGPAWPSSF